MKHRKSIQMKILMLVWCFILISGAVVIFVGYGYVGSLLHNDSEQIMEGLCREKSQSINEVLSNIEQSVNTVYYYAQENLKHVEDLKNKEYLEEYTSKVKEVAGNAVESTQGAISIYYRFNPEVSITSLDGFFISMNKDGKFGDTALTDLAKYDENDMEYVNWYYIPIQKGEPCWLDPYDNKTLNIKMISYIIPIYKDGKTVGVLGMDIDTELLYNQVKSVSAYESGAGSLLDSQGNLIYYKNIPNGVEEKEFAEKLRENKENMEDTQRDYELFHYKWSKDEKWMAMYRLRNNMVLCLTVPESEINAPKWNMVRKSLMLIGMLILVFSVMTIRCTKVLIQPLKELTLAARRVAQGDLEVNITCDTGDEIEELANSFQHTVGTLKEKMDYINGLAYVDSLTRTGNKTAYERKKKQIEEQMQSQTVEFAVAVMDINNLKWLNDTYGHEKGDMLIQAAAELMKYVFGQQDVYRIGGDEFAVILTEDKLKNRTRMMEMFTEEMAKYNRKEKGYEGELQIASGIAVYNKETDQEYADVFRRADSFMYQNKKEMKAKHSVMA